MTRAMTKLYLSYARTRQVGENAVEYAPSRFLAALSRDLVERVSASVPATVSAPPVVETAPDVYEDESTDLETVPAPARAQETANSPGTFVLIEDGEDMEAETEFGLWLREGQSGWLEHEVERAEEIETWVLAEFQDDTDLEAEQLAEEEMTISDELDTQLGDMQHELLDHLMELAEIEYERAAMVRLGSQTKSTAAEPIRATADEEPEDLDALAEEYADEIREHQLEMPERPEAQK